MKYPTFDFESYIQGYSSPTLLRRLLHIANSPPPPSETKEVENSTDKPTTDKPTTDKPANPPIPDDIRRAAHNLALSTAKSTGNVVVFKKLVPEASRTQDDNNWLTQQSQLNASAIQELQQRLNTSKSQLNKTATLENYRGLGEELRRGGKDTDALRELGRAQAFCTNQEQTFALCYTLITLSLSSSTFSTARSQISKSRSTPSSTPLSLLCTLGGGVADLIDGKWSSAFDTFTSTPGVSTHSELGKLTTASDVALYAAICGIAGGVGRKEIKDRVTGERWREWGEGDTEGRGMIDCWCKGEYGGVMETWDRLQTRILCDVYLSPHYHTLTTLLRQRCLTQYTLPYSTCRLESAARAVGVEREEVEGIVEELVKKGKIKGKRPAEPQT
ncbi:hypothetical protein TrCOL_g2387 [Triparma columacea]|uniref:PCI domain-containing protein n=1 Tax=Triparma columacea TaxID=722753 RepID=A0A9W7GCN5_9STRA|nr:hypothetical protein TrCOL_g2387 [Triparma columacea]